MFPAFRIPLKSLSFGVNLFFFVITFGILYIQYDPKLYYLHFQPFFAWDASYFDFMYQFRAGLLSVLSQFLLQFLYFPLAGTFLLSLLFLSLALLLQRAFHPLIKGGFEGLQWLVPFVLLALLKSCSTGIEVILALFLPMLLWLGSDYLRRYMVIRLLYDLLACILLFTSTGLLPTLFYIILLFPSERNTFRNSANWLSFACGMGLLSLLIFRIHDYRWFKIQLGQYSFFEAAVAFPGAWMILSIVVFLKQAGIYVPSIWKKIHEFLIVRIGNWYFPAIMLLFLTLFFRPFFHYEGKYRLQMDYFASQHDWKKVLQYKDKIDAQDRIPRIQLNRALANTGGLSENLFSVPQEWGEYGLFLTKEYNAACLTYSSDQFLDLGYIKASQYWMIEAQTKNPYRPDGLKRLAETSFLLGENTTAIKYLSILQKSPVYRKYAARNLDLLRHNPDGLKKQFATSNLTLLQEFAVLNLKDPDSEMILMLRSNRNNKMAFEYLMAYYLLRGDLKDFYHFAPLVQSSGYYKTMPVSYEEALLICYNQFGIPQESWPISISKQTLDRYYSFLEKTNHSDNKGIQKEALRTEFGQTYWYYMKYEQPILEGKRLKFKAQ